VRKGSIAERVLRITHLPSRPRAAAASAAADRKPAGSPARSASVSSDRKSSDSSPRRFWLKVVKSVARRWLISERRFLAAPSRRAPARTNSV